MLLVSYFQWLALCGLDAVKIVVAALEPKFVDDTHYQKIYHFLYYKTLTRKFENYKRQQQQRNKKEQKKTSQNA